jgi:exodeoxyribonuclease VII small subunit
MHLGPSDDSTVSDLDSLTFESALVELQNVVARLETGTLSLDETIASFQQGTELAARCQKLISEAELRITTLAGTNEDFSSVTSASAASQS